MATIEEKNDNNYLTNIDRIWRQFTTQDPVQWEAHTFAIFLTLCFPTAILYVSFAQRENVVFCLALNATCARGRRIRQVILDIHGCDVCLKVSLVIVRVSLRCETPSFF